MKVCESALAGSIILELEGGERVGDELAEAGGSLATGLHLKEKDQRAKAVRLVGLAPKQRTNYCVRSHDSGHGEMTLCRTFIHALLFQAYSYILFHLFSQQTASPESA